MLDHSGSGSVVDEPSDQPKSRYDFVEEVVKKQVRKIFSAELGQVERHRSALGKERIVRSEAWLSKKRFELEAKRIHKKVSEELLKYEVPDIDTWISVSIDDDFIKKCDDEPDKKFVNLVIAKLIWDRSKKIHKINKIYRKDWFEPPFCLNIKWVCSNCENLNSIDFAQRTLPDLEGYKCPKCKIVVSPYRGFRFDWEKLTLGKEFREKGEKLKEALLNHVWPPEPSPSHVEWNRQDQYIAFHRNKYRLPHDIRKFLNFLRKLPESENPQEDFYLAVKECEVNLEQLEKFGLIKTILIPNHFSEIAKQYVDGVAFTYKSPASFGWMSPFEARLDVNQYYYFDHFSFQGTSCSHSEEIVFNDYFFNDDSIFSFLSPKTINTRLVGKVFNSKAEKKCYDTLKRSVPANQSVLPNYPARSIFCFDDDSLKKEFNNEDLNYLKRAIFDFVIIDEGGTPVIVLELQLGLHHKKPEYNKKDLLKKKLCEFVGVQFQELF